MDPQTGLVKMQIEDLILTVDEKTAIQLTNDPALATIYCEQVRRAMLTGDNEDTTDKKKSSEIKTKVWSSKVQTEKDRSATLALQMRKNLNAKFNDKKNCKNTLWLEIATCLNDMGFYVGDSNDGREKCRQKFSNLQTAYIKYVDRKRQTGEGKVDPPPFYEELSKILGEKHKCTPTLLLDSVNRPGTSGIKKTQTQDETIKAEGEEETSKPKKTSSRFDCTKRVTKTDLLEKFYTLEEKKREDRKAEFACLTNFLNKESENRHAQMMALIKNMKGTKKRKREDSDSDD